MSDLYSVMLDWLEKPGNLMLLQKNKEDAMHALSVHLEKSGSKLSKSKTAKVFDQYMHMFQRAQEMNDDDFMTCVGFDRLKRVFEGQPDQFTVQVKTSIVLKLLELGFEWSTCKDVVRYCLSNDL